MRSVSSMMLWLSLFGLASSFVVEGDVIVVCLLDDELFICCVSAA